MENQQPPLPFTLSVEELSETDVQGIISMHRDSQTQTGHGRGLLNAKDSMCSVGCWNARLDKVEFITEAISVFGCLRGAELIVSFTYLFFFLHHEILIVW